MNHTFTFYCLWALSVVKLCRPLGACHAVKIKIHLHVHSHMLLLLRKYASTYIHPFPSPEPPKNILLLIRERIAKNISVFPCEINVQVILVTATCYIILGDECSKKREKGYEEIKRGKCPEPCRTRFSKEDQALTICVSKMSCKYVLAVSHLWAPDIKTLLE